MEREWAPTDIDRAKRRAKPGQAGARGVKTAPPLATFEQFPNPPARESGTGFRGNARTRGRVDRPGRFSWPES